MKTELIKMFKIAPIGVTFDPIAVNLEAVKAGYIIHPDCCNEDTLEFAKSLSHNYNSTFYKCWEQIEQASHTELFINQILHYASTYGSDFRGEPFIINNNPVEIPYTEYTIINPVTDQEIFDRCKNMITSGIALKGSTIDILIDEMAEHPVLCSSFNVEDITNKEAVCRWHEQFGTTPRNNFELLRYMVYMCTSNTLLIKDKETIQKIKQGEFDMGCLTRSQIESLSQIFYRFKPLFLAFRHQSSTNKKIVNQIRRLAKDNHKPFQAGFWETVLSVNDHKVIKEVRERVGELSNFKIVQLVQAARERLVASNMEGPTMYQIRNGKIFMKENECQILSGHYYFYEEFMGILIKQLIENLSKKACTVRFQDDITLACPSSEKNFIGALPFGTRFKMEDKNYIGIYWKNEWGTRDFDISAVDNAGNKIGWNTFLKNGDNTIIYSGDMTYANPEATEILLCKGDCPDAVIYVNRYCGEQGSKFELLYGSENTYNINDFDEQYMVKPDTLKVREMVESDSAQKMIGVITNGEMRLMDIRLNDARVSRGGKFQDMLKVINKKSYCFMDLKPILLKAGFKERKRDTKDNPIQLDLTKLDKDTLIELFS